MQVTPEERRSYKSTSEMQRSGNFMDRWWCTGRRERDRPNLGAGPPIFLIQL